MRTWGISPKGAWEGTRVVFVGGSRGTSPSLDLTFPPTGLSENLAGMERGRGKGKGKGGGDHLPYFPPPLASASNTTLFKEPTDPFLTTK